MGCIGAGGMGGMGAGGVGGIGAPGWPGMVMAGIEKPGAGQGCALEGAGRCGEKKAVDPTARRRSSARLR